MLSGVYRTSAARPAKVELERFGVSRVPAVEAVALGRRHANLKRGGHFRGDAILQREEVLTIDVIALPPQGRLVVGAHKLHGDTQTICGRLQRARQDVVGGQGLPGFLRAHGLPFVSEDRVGRADAHLARAGEPVDDGVGNPHLEKPQFGWRAKAVKWKHGDGGWLRNVFDIRGARSVHDDHAGNHQG